MSNAAEIIDVEPLPAKQVAQQQVAVQATTPSHLLAMAVQQGADLDKLQKLMDLQDRWEANEARKAFTVAMTGFKAEPVEILKRKNVSFQTSKGLTSYNHAELSDVTEAVGPALAKHQLAYDWDITQTGSAITVSCTLTHIRGHSKTVTMSAAPDNSGMKNAIQQVSSTATYLQRYTLLAITGMSTKGMDNDGRGLDPEPEQIDQRELDWQNKITAAVSIEECKGIKAEMLASYGDQKAIPGGLFKTYNEQIAKIKGQA
jgi:hypothetical protein